MRQIALGLMLTMVAAASARADEPATRPLDVSGALAGISFATAPVQEAADPAGKPYTVTVGIDVPADYYWRGILQNFNGVDREGVVAQPYVDVGFALSETVSLNVGYWTSLHSGDATGTFYEADYYASLGFAAGQWSPSVTYTAYSSPGDLFTTVHEVALGVGYDDSAAAVPLSPSLLLGFLSDGAGTYFEAGIEPAIPLEDSPVSLSIPVALGLSLNDFYGEETFGYVKAGVALGADLGSGWEAHGGLDLMFLGDATQWDDGSVKPVPYVGLSYTY